MDGKNIGAGEAYKDDSEKTLEILIIPPLTRERTRKNGKTTIFLSARIKKPLLEIEKVLVSILLVIDKRGYTEYPFTILKRFHRPEKDGTGKNNNKQDL